MHTHINPSSRRDCFYSPIPLSNFGPGFDLAALAIALPQQYRGRRVSIGDRRDEHIDNINKLKCLSIRKIYAFYMPTLLPDNSPQTRTTTCHFDMARMNLGPDRL